MDLQARVAAITQSVMAWHIARDCEINFNGRGNVSQETGCFGKMGCHLRVPVLVASLPQALASVTSGVPLIPQSSTASCGGKQMHHLQATGTQDWELTLEKHGQA